MIEIQTQCKCPVFFKTGIAIILIIKPSSHNLIMSSKGLILMIFIISIHSLECLKIYMKKKK